MFQSAFIFSPLLFIYLGKVETNGASSFSSIFCIYYIDVQFEAQHYTKRLVKGGCCDRQFHGLSAHIGSVGQFPDTEQLNTDRSSSPRPSLLVLYLLLHHPHQSISFHLSCLSFSPSWHI